jgi:hypothetical protein
MLAENRVALVSPQMHAQGNRLEAWFEEGQVLRDSKTRAAGPRSKPSETQSQSTGAARVDDSAAKSVVQVEGGVDVQQQRKGSNEPLRVTGETLSVNNRSTDEQTLRIQGAPAHIRSTEMHIEGEDVNLDRVKNLAKVDGAGLLEIPVTQETSCQTSS